MSTHKVTVSLIALTTTAALLLSAVPAAALAVGVNASASASASASTSPVSGAAAVRLQKIITQGDSDISARIDALNGLNARLQALKNVSASEKVSFSSTIQTNLDGLAALKSKLDADADATAAHTDAGDIFTTFRIYALVIPQGWIIASADRVATVSGLMTSLAANIQTRITADQAAGKDTTALTAALADMTAKIADAKSQSAAAQAGVSALVPDQGDKTVAAANRAALLAARADIKTATADLTAARKDITTLLDGLKALGGVSASGSTSTQ